MKEVTFVVEKTSTGFSAYSEDFEKYPVGTTGGNLPELQQNISHALELYLDYSNHKKTALPKIVIKYDIAQFFEYYKIINASALGERIGMSKSLLSQYVTGKKKAGPKQIQKILVGIKELGRELASLEIV